MLPAKSLGYDALASNAVKKRNDVCVRAYQGFHGAERLIETRCLSGEHDQVERTLACQVAYGQSFDIALHAIDERAVVSMPFEPCVIHYIGNRSSIEMRCGNAAVEQSYRALAYYCHAFDCHACSLCSFGSVVAPASIALPLWGSCVYSFRYIAESF